MEPSKGVRMSREARTVEKMVHMYCRRLHGTRTSFCSECDELLKYSMGRLEKCPYQEGKTNCAKCPVHCYKPEMREKIREVMRFSGPRMTFSHPLMALFHMKDSLRRKPVMHNHAK
jgi:hypothetical protein